MKKEVNVRYRTGKVITKKINGCRIEENECKDETIRVSNTDELLSVYPPVKISQSLILAVNSFLDGKRDKIEYNFGNGNALFTLK